MRDKSLIKNKIKFQEIIGRREGGKERNEVKKEVGGRGGGREKEGGWGEGGILSS